MVSDETYELCLPLLQDASLEDEEKTDKLEEFLKKETTLVGRSLDNAVLDVLWRYRESSTNPSSPPPMRHTVLRRAASPAPWPIPRGSSGTPVSSSPRLGVSPLAPPGFVPQSFTRAISSTASPFTSPRPSPRLALTTPVPRLWIVRDSMGISQREVKDSSAVVEISDAYASFNEKGKVVWEYQNQGRLADAPIWEKRVDY